MEVLKLYIHVNGCEKVEIGIGTILRMCFTFLDNIIHALKYLQRIFLNILFLYDAIEKTGTVSGVTGSPYLRDFCQNRIKVAVSRQGFHLLEQKP